MQIKIAMTAHAIAMTAPNTIVFTNLGPMCSGGYASINPFGNPDQLGQAQDLLGHPPGVVFGYGRLEKVRRVFAVHPA